MKNTTNTPPTSYVIPNLAARHDGRACIYCGRDDLLMRPTGENSLNGSQLFACVACVPAPLPPLVSVYSSPDLFP